MEGNRLTLAVSVMDFVVIQGKVRSRNKLARTGILTFALCNHDLRKKPVS
jgi:hypothetical protein